MYTLVDILQYGEQEVPNLLYCRDVQALVGGVDVAERRTEANHVEVRVLLREQTALQSGVDALDNRVLTEELVIFLYGNLHQFRVRIHLPCRISVGLGDLGSGELESSLNGVRHVPQVAHDVRALAGNDFHLLLRALNAGDIARGLNHPLQGLVLAHGEDTVVDGLQSADEILRNLLWQYLLGIGRCEVPLHGGVGNVIFVLHVA